MRELLGKRALVTGAAWGIGRAIALESARHGVDLFLWGIDAGRLTATQQDCQQLGVECTLHDCDLSSSIVFTTPETVARRAVGGIRRNRGKIVITPLAHSTWLIHRYLPSLLELISMVGRRKGPLPEPQPPDSPLAMPNPAGCAA